MVCSFFVLCFQPKVAKDEKVGIGLLLCQSIRNFRAKEAREFTGIGYNASKKI
jgi:hypothetical protein